MKLIASDVRKTENDGSAGIAWALYATGGATVDRDDMREIAVVDESSIDDPSYNGPGQPFTTGIRVRRNRKGRHVLVTQDFGWDV